MTEQTTEKKAEAAKTKKAPAPSKSSTAAKAAPKKRKAPAKELTPEEQEAIEAQKKAEAAAKEAEKLAQAAKKKRDQEELQAAVMKELDKDAKEINVRMEKVDKLGRQADDHRLAAAIRMDEAKERCREAKINFKEWSQEHIGREDAEGNFLPYSYETIRKLAPIGEAERKEEGAGARALADLRAGTKAAQQKQRDKAKAKSSPAPEPKSSGPKETPEAKALSALDAMRNDSKKNLIQSQAESLGYVLVDRDQAKVQNQKAKAAAPEFADIADLKNAFKEMSGADQMTFANWAAEEVGLFED